MKWNKHSKLENTHAMFGASKASWIRYDDDKLLSYFESMQAKERGTRLHAWAAETINLGIKQPRSKKTLYTYINDAIGFKMDTEVLLYYSDYFYGTADAISFRNNELRIHDLKTGKLPVHIEQLLIYAALFCLEYKVKPESLEKIELRIYQNDEVLYHNPEPEEIIDIMNNIIHKDMVLKSMNSKECFK